MRSASRRALMLSVAGSVGYRTAGAASGGVQQTGEKLLTVIRKWEGAAGGVAGSLERALGDTSDVTSGFTHSPQLQALQWLADLSTHNHNSDDRNIPDDADAALVQMYALGVLYFATNGDEWRECSREKSIKCEAEGPQSSSRFLSDGSVCDWFGLTCSDEKKKGLVTWIDLSHNDLEGSMPDELSLLTDNLELLWLSGNAKLGGTLPHWIGNAKNLQSLSFFDTSLGGTLPDSVYGLSKLWSLRLYGSQFVGPISTDISNLSKLQWLWIHGNNFTGSLPSELGSLKNLEALTVHGNNFHIDEEVPSEICDLRANGNKLEHLWTDCNADKTCRCCTRCWPIEEHKFVTKNA